MAISTIETVRKFSNLLDGSQGMNASLRKFAPMYGQPAELRDEWKPELLLASSDLHEKSAAPKHPVVLIYCDQIESRRAEKLRGAYSRVRIVTEIRVSQDRIEGITEQLHLYLDALRDVVEKNTGCSGPEMYLDGDYEASVEPVKKGGLNFLQIAKLTCWAVVNKS